MSPALGRRGAPTSCRTRHRPSPPPRRAAPRRERRALLKARDDALRDLGGLLVEMYRRGSFRDDLLAERARGDRRHRRAPRRDRRLCSTRAAARRAASAAPRSCAARGSARIAAGRSIRRPGAGRAPPRRPSSSRLPRPDGDGADERERAIAAADTTCPRCGAAREPDQRFCLECGLALPNVEGRVPALRRRWLRRFGWYPGDWVWISLLTLLVAAAGAAAAIALTVEHRDAGGETFSSRRRSPSPSRPQCRRRRPATVDTSTLPTAPEPTTTSKATPAGPKNGRFAWPRNQNGWTIVLVSYPKTNGRPSALATADRAAAHGLHQVGILDSSRLRQPAARLPRRLHAASTARRSDADAGVSTARQAGFGGAYSRQIAR